MVGGSGRRRRAGARWRAKGERVSTARHEERRQADGAPDAPAENAVLTDRESGGAVALPILEGTLGPKVLDIRALYAGTGKFSYDPGFTATGSCKSKITYIDGEQGVLLHRGYPIDELAARSDFLEVAYLMLYGELPNAAERPPSSTPSPTTRWCTSRSTICIGGSGAMRIRWR